MEWLGILTSPATVWTLAGSFVLMALLTSVAWNRIINNSIETIRRASQSFQKVEGQTTFVAEFYLRDSARFPQHRKAAPASIKR